ncbi:MAG: hypothetical protein AAFZ17_09305 [Cyanobacteria bacterium J06650_10]
MQYKVLAFTTHIFWFFFDHAMTQLIKALPKRRRDRSLFCKNYISDLYGMEFVRTLFQERYLRRKDVIDIFGDEATYFAVLHDQHPLTFDHINKLSDHFRLPPQVFFPRKS